MARLGLLLAGVLILAGAGHMAMADEDLYLPDGPVMLLNGSTWDRIVRYGGISAVEFYAPWCKYCQQFAPQYLKVAKTLKGLALVGAINCDEEANTKICRMENIQGFPTVKVYGADKQINPYTGDVGKDGVALEGPFTTKKVYNAIASLYNDSLIEQITTQEQHEAFVSNSTEVPRIVLYTNKAEASLLYEALSFQYNGDYAFGMVTEATSKELIDLLQLTAPSLMLYEGNQSTVYDGPLKQEQLHMFLAQHLVHREPPQPDDVRSTANYSSLPTVPVYNISSEQLKEINNDLDMYLVGFHKSEGEQCKEQVDAFIDAAGLGKDQYCRAAIMNVSGAGEALREQLTAMGVDLPALDLQPCSVQAVLFPFGEDKEYIDDYRIYKGAINVTDFKEFVFKNLPDLTTRLDYEEAIASFIHRPHPDDPEVAYPPKIILVTTKGEVPPVFKALAMNLRAKTWITAAWADAESSAGEALLTQFKGKKAPAIISIMPVPQTGPTPGHDGKSRQISISTDVYQGPLKYPYMYMYYRRFAVMTGFDRSVKTNTNAREEGKLVQLDSNKAFQKHCVEAGGLCQISFLNPAADGYENITHMLRGLALVRKNDPIAFMEVDATRQPSFTREFGISLSELPRALVFSPKKQAFVSVLGGVEYNSVFTAIQDALAGRARPIFMNSMPRLVDGGEEPAAAHEQMEPEGLVEEEFDLTEVMTEEVDLGLVSKEEQIKQAEEQIKAEQEAAEKKKKKKKNKKKKKKAAQPRDEL